MMKVRVSACALPAARAAGKKRRTNHARMTGPRVRTQPHLRGACLKAALSAAGRGYRGLEPGDLVHGQGARAVRPEQGPAVERPPMARQEDGVAPSETGLPEQ